ncbi:expressed unknown protein [Seminavis robusta]|uniref:Uncharacterized protein n=1 Tax=Seminavis robusta TaxID=568900 RepID=A0A9N8HLH1_9STRA|nr:expressed unknown protein [Seminavis robusta]|eukprot:Sro915_g219730.1 n/a (311) ;mRNA; r:24371-25303
MSPRYDPEDTLALPALMEVDGLVVHESQPLAVSAPKPRQAFAPASTWGLRLFTKEDATGLHKFPSIFQTLTALALAAIGASSGFEDMSSPLLEPLTAAFCVSTALQSVTAVKMAYSHRREEPMVRNVFVNMSIICFLQAMAGYWVAPFAPECFNDPVISKGLLTIVPLISLAMFVPSFTEMDDLIGSQLRRDKRKGEKDFRSWLTTAPYLFTAPVMVAVIAAFGAPGVDRLEFFDLVSSTPELSFDQASLFYNQIGATVGVAYLGLYVTLRDKGLITKDTEIMLTTVTSVLVLGLTIDQARELGLGFFLG